VLALLLLDLGRTVSPELLIDRVWGEEPPASARNLLYGYVARLRAGIGAAAEPDVQSSRVPGGYLLRAAPMQLDLCRFRRLIADVAMAGADERAAALLREALRLWRGPDPGVGKVRAKPASTQGPPAGPGSPGHSHVLRHAIRMSGNRTLSRELM
jgi:DNA-binding SARP family transcriptional activator